MIVVQRIVTEWSKASRGGNGAAERNATPRALKLPPVPADTAVALHQVSYREATAFDSRTSTLSTDVRLPLRLGCVEIKGADDGALVLFRYTVYCGGAPERGWARKDVRLARGQWAQVEYNGQFAWEGDWVYRHTVMNVACVDVASSSASSRRIRSRRHTVMNVACVDVAAPKLFANDPPNIRFSALAHLW